MPEHKPTTPDNPEPSRGDAEFATSQQADVLQKAVMYLLDQKGIGGAFYRTDASELPPNLLLGFPAAADIQDGTAKAPLYEVTVVCPQSQESGSSQSENGEKPMVTLELGRRQWVNLDKPDPIKGNLEVVHAVYVVMGYTPDDEQEPSEYSLEKYIIVDRNSFPLITGPNRIDDLPGAVPFDEAAALIDYVAGQAASGSFDGLAATKE